MVFIVFQLPEIVKINKKVGVKSMVFIGLQLPEIVEINKKVGIKSMVFIVLQLPEIVKINKKVDNPCCQFWSAPQINGFPPAVRSEVHPFFLRVGTSDQWFSSCCLF